MRDVALKLLIDFPSKLLFRVNCTLTNFSQLFKLSATIIVTCNLIRQGGHAMLKKSRYAGFSFLSLVISLSLWALASCGGGGGNSDGGTQLTATQKAAASASAAEGAIALSSNVAGSADMASGYIPAGYAPGKRGPRAGTDAIANIDPRLKKVVDKMHVQMQRPAVRNTLSKAAAINKILSAPSTIFCVSGGSYVVSDTISSSGTATTHTLTVTYNACKDNFYNNIINGSISATHTIDAVATSESATVTITNLTDTTYYDTSYTQETDILALNGTFTSNSTGNLTAGTASALGAFTWTIVDAVYGNVVMAFNFGTGATPITDTWTTSSSAGNTTEIHTANGAYGLSITSPGAQPISLGITLTNLTDKVVSNFSGIDEWINGSISIVWSPDLSQWGCLNGTYTFTTANSTPIHTPGYGCPTSGTVQVNNATIEFGKPSGTMVTVTLTGTGLSEVFSDCMSMGGGMCGS